MSETAWPAPAKLNLFLHIVGRRPDGYHRLQTLFQFLDHGDTVYLRPRRDGRIRRVAPVAGVPEGQDLAVRAARRLQAHTGRRLGVDIRVQKRLPMGGGLGGGSSDAATVLVALNAIWRTGLDLEALARLGLKLGADVPVFVRGEAAWGEGVGEALTPAVLDEPWFLVIHPGPGIATAEVFASPGLTRNTPAMKIPPLLPPGAGGYSVAGVMAGTRNDCQAVVSERYPAVREALDWLARHAPSRMTGSGACVFAPFPDETRARAVLVRLPSRWEGFVARGRRRSPLYTRAAGEQSVPGRGPAGACPGESV